MNDETTARSLATARAADLIRGFGARRKVRGWKREIADLLGISPSYVSMLLREDPPLISLELAETMARRIRLRRSYFSMTESQLEHHRAFIEELRGEPVEAWESCLLDPLRERDFLREVRMVEAFGRQAAEDAKQEPRRALASLVADTRSVKLFAALVDAATASPHEVSEAEARQLVYALWSQIEMFSSRIVEPLRREMRDYDETTRLFDELAKVSGRVSDFSPGTP